jgi:hypothetical protein
LVWNHWNILQAKVVTFYDSLSTMTTKESVALCFEKGLKSVGLASDGVNKKNHVLPDPDKKSWIK